MSDVEGARIPRRRCPSSTAATPRNSSGQAPRRPRLATALAEVHGGRPPAPCDGPGHGPRRLWPSSVAAASWPRFDATAPHNGALAQFRGGRALAELRVVVALYKPVVVIAELAVEGEKLDAFLFRERQTGTDDCVMSGKGLLQLYEKISKQYFWSSSSSAPRKTWSRPSTPLFF